MEGIFMKKLISILLVLMTVSFTLMGCSTKEEPQKSGTQDKPKTETTPTEEAAQKEQDTSPVTITAVIKDMSADDEVSVKLLETISKAVSEQLGREVHIELAPISEGTYSESMSLLIQSGVIPDLMYFQGGDYQFAITQEILEDLTPYIEKSTYVKAMMQSFNQERMENYPYLLWMSPDRIKVPLIRQDWLDSTESGAALLADPTPENYKAFFTELKEKYNLTAAYTVPGDIAELDTVFNLAFGVTQSWIKEGDSYVYSKVSAAQKEKLAYYVDLYNKGLLDNEWLIKTWETKESAFYSGEVAVVSGTQGAVVNVYNKKQVNQNGESAKLAVLPPAKGVAQGYTPSDVSKESRGWAISAYSENKDVVFAVLEYMASPQGQILDKLGYEGEHYNVTNNEYVLTDKISEWWARFHESVATFDVKLSAETPYYSEAANTSLDMVNKYMSFDNTFVMPDDYSTNWDACNALCSEFIADVICGNRPLDDFDAFVAKWNELGGAEITEYANTVLK
jgi:putative aldouronate transport system substrate-binding protein